MNANWTPDVSTLLHYSKSSLGRENVVENGQ